MGKNIILCFDGTSNHPRDAKQEREWFGLGDIEDNGITNILKLHVLFGGNLANTAATPKQHSLYYSGVGTYGNGFQRLFNAAFSPEKLDVGWIIKSAGKDLKRLYDKSKGDRIFIFGFSRGAAIARRFSSVINNYIDVAEGEQPVTFLCVFDTVASIGAPNLSSDDKPISDVVFEDCWVSKHIQQALHIVAVDENRVAFQPTLMNQEGRVKEIWFPGAHSDIGGGFWFDGLSDITLDFVLKQFKKRNLGLSTKKLTQVNYSELVADDGSYQIDIDDLTIKPLIKGRLHRKDRWWPIARATLGHRDIRTQNKVPNAGDMREGGVSVPFVHKSLKERFDQVTDYRPRAMKGIRHQLVDDDSDPVGPDYIGLSNY